MSSETSSDIKDRLRNAIAHDAGNSDGVPQRGQGADVLIPFDLIDDTLASIQTLEADVAHWKEEHEDREWEIESLTADRDRLAASIQADQIDARRYRYWRDHHGWTGYFDDGASNSEKASDVDAAIDAALRDQSETKP